VSVRASLKGPYTLAVAALVPWAEE
jgi:hypothetical protein